MSIKGFNQNDFSNKFKNSFENFGMEIKYEGSEGKLYYCPFCNKIVTKSAYFYQGGHINKYHKNIPSCIQSKWRSQLVQKCNNIYKYCQNMRKEYEVIKKEKNSIATTNKTQSKEPKSTNLSISNRKKGSKNEKRRFKQEETVVAEVSDRFQFYVEQLPEDNEKVNYMKS